MSVEKASHKFTMKYLLRTYSAVVILLVIGVTSGILFYLQNMMRSQLLENERGDFENTILRMEEEYSTSVSYLQNLLSNSSEIMELNIAQSDTDIYFAILGIKDELSDFTQYRNAPIKLFFYTDKSENEGFVTAGYNSNSVEYSLLKYIRGQDLSLLPAYSTEMVMMEDSYFEVVYITIGNYCAGLWFDVQEFLEYSSGQINSANELLIAGEDGICYTGSLKGESILSEDSSLRGLFDTGTYYLLTGDFYSGDFQVIELVSTQIIRNSIQTVFRITGLIIVLLVVLLFLIQKVLERMFYRPVRAVIVAIRAVAEGNFETEVQVATSLREIDVLESAVNQMVKQIKTLRIDIYEEQLKEKEVELQYLQVQIHPHFLTNSLNSIYSMIQLGQTQNAQQMCLYLSDYFRFLYLNRNSLITLGEELKQTQAYISIQNTRYGDKVNYVLDVDEDVRFILVPPLSVTTFVENSYKYGIKKGQKGRIEICAHSEEEYVVVQIRDSGDGFSEDILKILNAGERLPVSDNVGTGIGVHNVVQRMEMVYKKKGRVVFSNEEGACVKIYIPLQY